MASVLFPSSSPAVVPSTPSSPLPSATDSLPSPPQASAAPNELPDEGRASLSISEMMTFEDPYTLLHDIRSMSSRMFEIRSKIFELQEIRHSEVPTQTSSSPAAPSASAAPPASSPKTTPPQIDDLLILIDKYLEQISLLVPAMQQRVTRLSETHSESEDLEEVQERWEEVEEEWEDVVKEVESVKEELKEDRWLTVFRTAAGQASDMMDSLEKVVLQCNDVVHKVHKLQTSRPSPGLSRPGLASPPSSWGADMDASLAAPGISISSFETVLKSFEAKKKYYYPSVERVLSVLDKGARERVTRNGEVLLSQERMLTRWRSLSDRLNRLGPDLTSAHLFLIKRDSPLAHHQVPRPLVHANPTALFRTTAPLVSPPPSEGGSSTGGSRYGAASRATPPVEASTKPRRASFARSMSPLQGMIGRMTMRGSGAGGGGGTAKTPKESPSNKGGSSSPGYFSSRFSIKARTSSASSPGPSTPRSENFGTPSSTSTEDQMSPSVMRAAKPRWNSSTQITNLPLPSPPPLPRPTPSPRAPLSRRISTANLRSVSGGGALSPARPASPTLSDFGSGRRVYQPPRPTTPSRIPRKKPSRARLSMDGEDDDIPSSLMQQLSPERRSHTPTPMGPTSPRPSPRLHSKSSSVSLIQVPSFSVYPASASETSLSPSSPNIIRRGVSPNASPGRPTSPLGFSPPRPLDRSQTPDNQIRATAIRSSFYTPAKPSLSSTTIPSSRPRPSATVRGGSPASSNPSPSGPNSLRSPPSSYRGDLGSPQSTPSRARPSGAASSSTPATAPATSRPPSRAGAATPSGEPSGMYKADKRNPLDVEIGRIVNGVLHIHVERIDPIPKGALQAAAPEANTAQYAFYGGGGKKILACRLLELSRGSRAGETTKVRKVMVRVGGGWLDLEMHIFKLGL